MADFDDWAKDSSGNIIVRPLIGIATMVFAEMGIGLRLFYAQPGDQLMSPSGNLQLAITPIQARELARALLTAAERIESQPVPKGPRS